MRREPRSIHGLRGRRSRGSESGFTLIEILVAMALMAIVLTLSVGALRHFWLVRSLKGSGETVTTSLRSAQEKVVSESYPLVYGARFDVGTKTWYAIRYDPKNSGAGDDTCTITETNSVSSGVVIKSASFSADAYITEFCRSQMGAPGTAAFVLFYPRGYATAGSVVLEQTALSKERTITVAGLTGRVTSQ